MSRHLLVPVFVDHTTLRNKHMVHSTLSIKNTSITFFEQSCRNFMALGDDFDLLQGLYRKY
jgi:hypothetical protein